MPNIRLELTAWGNVCEGRVVVEILFPRDHVRTINGVPLCRCLARGEAEGVVRGEDVYLLSVGMVKVVLVVLVNGLNGSGRQKACIPSRDFGVALGNNAALSIPVQERSSFHLRVEAGDIGFAHLTLIARTASAVEEASPGRGIDEPKLLEKARDLSVGRFRNFCSHARHMAASAAFVAGEISAVEARYFEMKLGEDGLYSLRRTLDGEGGATLRAALEPLARRSGQGDDRNRGRRLADALIELGTHSGGGVRPHLQVTTSLETLLQRAGAPAADLEHALPISGKAVERLACDCNVTRILLNADSCVIDVGRSRRNISGPMRKALIARDKGCGWPGCDRLATWTSGHHIVFWTRGGPTDLPNLVLLCYRHHWMVHEGAWQLVRADDGRMLAIPPTIDGPLPRTRGPGEEAA